MYTSTYKALVTGFILVMMAIWGSIVLASTLPQKPEGQKTYIELYTQCMGVDRYSSNSEDCKELAIKQMETYKNERQNQGSTGQSQGDSAGDSKEQ